VTYARTVTGGPSRGRRWRFPLGSLLALLALSAAGCGRKATHQHVEDAPSVTSPIIERPPSPPPTASSPADPAPPKPAPSSTSTASSDRERALALARQCATEPPIAGRGVDSELVLDEMSASITSGRIWYVTIPERAPQSLPSGVELFVDLDRGTCRVNDARE